MAANFEIPPFENSADISRALDEAMVKFGKELSTQRQMLEELKVMKEQNDILAADIEKGKKTLFGLLEENVRLREMACVKDYGELIDRDLGTIDSAAAKGQKKP